VRLHAVHHSDVELDATTTHRHHPLESLFTALVTLPLLVALAPPVLAVLAYSVVALAVSTLSHGNLHLPAWLDRGLRGLVVTPAYHRVHHSAYQPQTDSNYATVLPLFDHLFRSASPCRSTAGASSPWGWSAGATSAASRWRPCCVRRSARRQGRRPNRPGPAPPGTGVTVACMCGPGAGPIRWRAGTATV
jgi:hypothetical protein